MTLFYNIYIHTEISSRILTEIIAQRKGLTFLQLLSYLTKAVYWLGFYFEGGDQKLYFLASYRLHCVKWDSSESERQRSETEGDGWREGGVDRVRSDFGNQPKVTLFIQSCQRCGDAPDRNNNTAIRPASAKHTRTLLDSEPLYLLIRRTFIDICMFPSCGIIARTDSRFQIFLV